MNDNILEWKKMPVLLSSTKDSSVNDQFYDFRLYIEKDTGIVRQQNIPPLDILYKDARNSAVGSVWNNHNEEFFKFIKNEDLNNKRICEIGSGSGALALLISEKYNLTCYEPNPNFELNDNITLIKKFFDNVNDLYDIIILSHTLEHLPDIDVFLSEAYKNLNKNGKLIVSVPNFEIALKNNFINTFNTEHISYFTPESLEKKFNEHGLFNCKVHLYTDHSIFISGTKTLAQNTKITASNTDIIKNLVDNYITALNKKINKAKRLIESNNNDLYIFGCHAMASIFLNISKIDEKVFKGIIDNDHLKWNTRLYGTNLFCYNPKIATGKTVLLNGAAYHDDILKSLTSINCNVLEWK